MEHNFIQMAAWTGHAVACTIVPIFISIYRMCATVFHPWLHEYSPLKRQLCLACRHNTYLWPQVIVQRWQMAVPRWPNDISSAANNATVTRFGCVYFIMYMCGFSVPQMRQLCLFTYSPKAKLASSEKNFFVKIRIFCASIVRPPSEALFKRTQSYTTIFVQRKDKTIYL